jgi:hypothetical protein
MIASTAPREEKAIPRVVEFGRRIAYELQFFISHPTQKGPPC